MKKLLLLLSLSLLACNTCKVANVSKIQEIQFGAGGGITGDIRTYSLDNKGNLYYQEKLVKKISGDSISVLLKLAEQLPQEDLVNSGNRYCFLRIISKDSAHYYAWSLDKDTNPKVVELYNKLKIQL